MPEIANIEDLKARLTICRQQLECNSLLNTTKRKDALRVEILSIEQQLAKALGISDDDDNKSDSEQPIEPFQKDGGTTTPESTHLPSVNSPGRTRSPSPFMANPSSDIKKEESDAETPPIFTTLLPSSKASSSNAPATSTLDKEAESVISALVDAGEDEMDLEVLLREQALMEQRLVDLKRRREEEDEAFARSIQDEEIRAYQSQAGSSSSLPVFSGDGGSLMQSRLDRAHQERLDAEMAKIFAESETSSFNLALSPKKKPPLDHGKPMPAPSERPVFSIFEKRPRIDSTAAGTSGLSNRGATSSSSSWSALQPKISGSTASYAPNIPALSCPPKTPSFTTAPLVPTTTAALKGSTSSLSTKASPPSILPKEGLDRLQSHAAAILASASGSNSSSSSSSISSSSSKLLQTSQKNTTVDLTKPVVDLTKPVYEIPSSDDEADRNNNGVGSSSSWNALNPLMKSFNDLYSEASHKLGGYHDCWSEEYSSGEEDEYDIGFDDELDGYPYGSNYQQWMLNQRLTWSYGQGYERDYNRNLTSEQTEKELRDLLANIQAAEEEIAPQDRTGTPEGMASHIALLEHQKIGLTWLQKMEDGTNRGGILGDDMGLGKTVQAMALIVSRPCGPIDDPVIWDDRKVYFEPPPESVRVKTKATLVVAPTSLIYQWAEELRTKTQPGLLKVHIYHGGGKFADPELIRRYDVIVTTIGTLAAEIGVKDVNPAKSKAIGTLFKAQFHRVVIDEAHTIKNKHTKSSKACAQIAATYRWCLTGTPIQNTVDELYSLIRFLRIKPYCDWDEFRNKISAPMKKTKQYGPAIQRVQALLKAVCLRRTKKCTVDGRPILQLPDRNVDRVATPFSDEERAFYAALEHRTRERFNAYVKAGTVMKNYSNILVLLLRLRQACCHPHLITDFEKVENEQTPQDQKAHVDHLLDNLLEDIRRRLIERGMEAVECPICMDVGEESVILSGCGHIYCRACITAHLSRHDDDDRKCPECRRLAPIEDLISVADFNARFNPTPEPVPEDLKGKGKAVVEDGDIEGLPGVVVPEGLDEWISSSKIDKMIEVVRSVIAKREKIIVFSQFTSLLTLIEKPLLAENIKYLRYDGAMTVVARNEAVQRMFNDPTCSVMLISLKCGSLGLNLTVANHVVIMDPWWNPALENQAIDRVHRIGQTKNVFVHRLCIPDTVEDRILALQAKKQALANGALGEGEVPKLAKLGLQELMYLFRGG